MARKKRTLDPSELKAVEEHKWYLSERAGREVSICEAIEDFREHYRRRWLEVKFLDESREQVDEIVRYRWCRSEGEGHDIGKECATIEWIEHFAAIWRQRKESLEANGFRLLNLTVTNEEGLSIEPAFTLSEIAVRFDCDIYLHLDYMEFCNFVLNGEEYLNVKSIICPQALTVKKGGEIKIIATGSEAEEALGELRRFLDIEEKARAK